MSRWLNRLWSLALLVGVGVGIAYAFAVERGRDQLGRGHATATPPSSSAAPVALRAPLAHRQTIRVGWTAWADAEIVARLVERH